ncbi:MAG: diguanylate cyclase domain-containing protein [Usitatibacter sp.]
MSLVRIARRWLVLVAIVLASGAGLGARAQQLLDADHERLELWPQVRVLTDPDGKLGVAQAIAARDRFTVPQGAYATLGLDRVIVWLRVPLAVARGGEGQWILDLDYALLNHVDVYTVVGGSVVGHATLGDARPFASRPLRGRTHAVPLEFAAGSSPEILIRIDTPGAKILPLWLSRLPSFHAGALGEQLLQGFVGGLAILLVLYSLAQWVSLRENLYVKYAVLVFFSAMFSVHFFGIGEMYLWTDRDWPQRHLAGVTSLMAAAATALFVEDALSRDLNRWLRRGLRAVAAWHVVATALYAADLIDIRAVAVIMSTTGLAPALMGLPGALAKARRGDSIGGWFMTAWLGYFIASAIMVGTVRGRIGAGFWTLHSFQIGATLDMLIFMRIAVLRSAARHLDAQRAAKERDTLHSLAHSDPLTGLLNRRGLDDALATALPRVGSDRVLALYMLDLDGFKPVNDQFGHDVGDELLRVVAKRLRACMRAKDAVARLGGDEFVVMADGLTSEAQATELGRKLLQSLRSPFALDEKTCSVSATIGYSLAPTDGNDPGALLKAADAAMYAGKQEGKDRLVRVGE